MRSHSVYEDRIVEESDYASQQLLAGTEYILRLMMTN